MICSIKLAIIVLHSRRTYYNQEINHLCMCSLNSRLHSTNNKDYHLKQTNVCDFEALKQGIYCLALEHNDEWRHSLLVFSPLDPILSQEMYVE